MIAAMLPIRHQSIFKSRWIALLWAGGIIWSAVEFTGGQPAAPDNNQAGTDSAASSDNGGADETAAVRTALKSLQGLK